MTEIRVRMTRTHHVPGRGVRHEGESLSVGVGQFLSLFLGGVAVADTPRHLAIAARALTAEAWRRTFGP